MDDSASSLLHYTPFAVKCLESNHVRPLTSELFVLRLELVVFFLELCLFRLELGVFRLEIGVFCLEPGVVMYFM